MADDQPAVQPVSEPRLAPNQNFEKRWTLQKTGDQIDKLDVTMPGLVYVSHDPTRATSVRVSSESAELLDHVTVTQNNGDSSTTIQIRGTGKMVGHLLTEVSLQHEQAVHSLSTSGSATVVVEDGALLTNKKLNNHQQTLSVKAAGSGDVFATSTRPFEVHSMRIASRSSGRLQVVAPAVLTKSSATIKSRGSGDVNVFVNDVASTDVLLSVAGSGDINLTASATINLSGELQSSIAGSGKASIFSNVLDAFSIKSEVAGSGSIATVAWSKLVASTMTTEVAGSGNVAIACGGVGSASRHEVSIVGCGNVDASDVLTDSSDVNIAGSGDVALRVAREAHESLLGSGTVRYAGLLPARVLSTGVRASFGSQSRQSSAQPLAASLAAAQRAPQAPPARAAAFSHLRAAQLVDWSGVGDGDGGAVARFLHHLFRP